MSQNKEKIANPLVLCISVDKFRSFLLKCINAVKTDLLLFEKLHLRKKLKCSNPWKSFIDSNSTEAGKYQAWIST